jgi:hypothetical protein
LLTLTSLAYMSRGKKNNSGSNQNDTDNDAPNLTLRTDYKKRTQQSQQSQHS